MPWNSEAIIGSVASGVITWLIASMTKVGKADHEKVIQRLDTIEKDLTGRMTRAEFADAFSEVKVLVREFRTEARAEFKELKSELKTKT
jgi:hypothetical protein